MALSDALVMNPEVDGVQAVSVHDGLSLTIEEGTIPVNDERLTKIRRDFWFASIPFINRMMKNRYVGLETSDS